MNREEHLTFCKKCQNQQMDLNQGIVCSLTQRQANFVIECPEFKIDESLKVQELDNENAFPREEIIQNLQPAIIEKLRTEQNLQAGLFMGSIIGIVGALLWAVITVATEFQIGYMAVAIGFGVGYGIRRFGNGIDPVFGLIGAGISLLSCLLGNFFGIVGFVANAESLGYLETFLSIDYSYVPEIMMESFSPIDLVFYGVAVFEGYKFSFRKITEEEIEELNRQPITKN